MHSQQCVSDSEIAKFACFVQNNGKLHTLLCFRKTKHKEPFSTSRNREMREFCPTNANTHVRLSEIAKFAFSLQSANPSNLRETSLNYVYDQAKCNLATIQHPCSTPSCSTLQGPIQHIVRTHPAHIHLGPVQHPSIQDPFRTHSGPIQDPFRIHSGSIQGPSRTHPGPIQDPSCNPTPIQRPSRNANRS